MSVALASPSSPSTRRAIVIFGVIYVLQWALLPPLLSQSHPLDVVESLSWGREWQWGTYKHPPLAPVVLHIFYVVFGKFGPYLLSQVCIALTLWCVWRTGLRLMSADRALVGTVLTMAVAYYNFPALEYNHNIAQMPIWAALGWCLLAALQDGRLWQWLLLGLLAGLGLLTKYSVGVLLACMGLYLLLTPDRKVLKGIGPWLTLLVIAAVFAPHAWWLHQSDWLPFAYASSRAEGAPSRLNALGFLLTQALNHVPMILILGLSAWLSRRAAKTQPQEAFVWHTARPLYLCMLALAPGLLVTVMGLVTGARVRDMWGVPMWAFSGLMVMAVLPTAWFAPMRRKLLRGVGIWLVLVTVFALVYVTFGAQLRKRPARMDWPAAAIAQQAQQTWQAHSSCKLDVVAGEYWLAGLVATASLQGPSVLIHGDARYSPWVNLSRLQAHGALWLWQPDKGDVKPPEPLHALDGAQGIRMTEGTWTIPWAYSPKAKPLELRWRTYVPEACAVNPMSDGSGAAKN